MKRTLSSPFVAAMKRIPVVVHSLGGDEIFRGHGLESERLHHVLRDALLSRADARPILVSPADKVVALTKRVAEIPADHLEELTVAFVPFPKVLSTTRAFCALPHQGSYQSIKAWGSNLYGGAKAEYSGGGRDVVVAHSAATFLAFAVAFEGGGLLSWGSRLGGGDCCASSRTTGETVDLGPLPPEMQAETPAFLLSTRFAFMAVSGCRKAVHTWGNMGFGASPLGLAEALKGRQVASAAASRAHFALALSDGTVAVWGNNNPEHAVRLVAPSSPSSSPVRQVVLSFNGETCVVVSEDGRPAAVAGATIVPLRRQDDAQQQLSSTAAFSGEDAVIVGIGEETLFSVMEVRRSMASSLGGDADLSIDGSSTGPPIVSAGLNAAGGAILKNDSKRTAVTWATTYGSGVAPRTIANVDRLVVPQEGLDAMGVITRAPSRTLICWGTDDLLFRRTSREVQQVRSVAFSNSGVVCVHVNGEVSSFGVPWPDSTCMSDWEIGAQVASAIAVHGGAVDVTSTTVTPSTYTVKSEAFACTCLDGTVISWGDMNLLGIPDSLKQYVEVAL